MPVMWPEKVASEVRQKKINIILRRESIYNLSTSLFISAHFNWTHYTESVVFLQEIPELSMNSQDENT